MTTSFTPTSLELDAVIAHAFNGEFCVDRLPLAGFIVDTCDGDEIAEAAVFLDGTGDVVCLRDTVAPKSQIIGIFRRGVEPSPEVVEPIREALFRDLN